jgi:hypothetical protein
MDIEKQQPLTNPSRAFGELQTTLNINQGFGGRALQRGLLLVRAQRLRTGAKNCGVFPARLIMMKNCRNGLSENRSHGFSITNPTARSPKRINGGVSRANDGSYGHSRFD